MFGLFGMGNFGNEASLVAALEAVARVLPGARVTTISTDPVRVERSLGVPGIAVDHAGSFGRLAAGGRVRRIVTRPLLEIARWAAAVRHLWRVDLMVVPGTGILDDFGQRATQLPLDVLRWSVASRLARTRLMYIAIGAGPIVDPVSRRLMRAALACADFCSYRDEGSREFMNGLGRDTTGDEVWPDLVFALADSTTSRSASVQPLRVAIGVMAYRGWRANEEEADRIHSDYLHGLETLAERLRVTGHAVSLVIGEDGDLPTAEIVARRLEGRVAVCRSTAFGDVRDALVSADVLIASRFHNLIAALVVGIPAISLGYAEKNERLLAAFGLGDLCQHIEDFDIDVALDHLASIEARYPSLVADVTQHAMVVRAEVKDRLDRQLLR